MMALKSLQIHFQSLREKIKSYKDEYTGGDFLGTAFHLPSTTMSPLGTTGDRLHLGPKHKATFSICYYLS